ncbi:MAG: Na+/H+ antiporter NhaA [Cytophagales bacterium]
MVLKRFKQSKLDFNFREFLHGQQASGIILILCTILSLIIANSSLHDWYHHIWHVRIAIIVGHLSLDYSLHHWINDGLMAIFFLFVGLEIKREMLVGELSDLRSATLPVAVALGGMIVPAGIYSLFNAGKATISGFGIPMATDIAFALGALSLLGNKVPVNLKIFLTALAVIDDLGAIIVIALFYGGHFDLTYFLMAIGVFVFLLLLNKLKVNSMFIYLGLGALLWYFTMQSGIHATIAGVLLAFTIPFNSNGEDESLSSKLEHQLLQPVNFIIMPIFALANTAIDLDADVLTKMNWNITLGILFGLMIGKVVGIVSFTYACVKLNLSSLPEGVKWKHVAGMGFLAGIGFTMSIFVANLAFTDENMIDTAKIVIIFSSTLAGLVGYYFLKIAKS